MHGQGTRQPFCPAAWYWLVLDRIQVAPNSTIQIPTNGFSRRGAPLYLDLTPLRHFCATATCLQSAGAPASRAATPNCVPKYMIIPHKPGASRGVIRSVLNVTTMRQLKKFVHRV